MAEELRLGNDLAAALEEMLAIFDDAPVIVDDAQHDAIEAAHAAIAAWNRRSPQDGRERALAETLRKAAAQFRFYECEHRAKYDAYDPRCDGPRASTDRLQKAATNQRFAEMCEAALHSPAPAAHAPIVPPDDDAIEWARKLDAGARRHDDAKTQADRDAASRAINDLILDDERIVQMARALLARIDVAPTAQADLAERRK